MRFIAFNVTGEERITNSLFQNGGVAALVVGSWVLGLGATQVLKPTGVAAGGGVGSPSVRNATIFPTGIAPGGGVGSPSVRNATIFPVGLAAGGGIGLPTLAHGAGAQSLFPIGIAAVGGVGSPTLTAGSVSISPIGIAADGGVGLPSIRSVSVFVIGIGASGGVGSPEVTAGPVSVLPIGIAPGGGVGVPTVSAQAEGSLPMGLVFLWPGTNQGIPAGWERETALDNRYPFLTDNDGLAGTPDGQETHEHLFSGVHQFYSDASYYTSDPAASSTEFNLSTDGHTHDNKNTQAGNAIPVSTGTNHPAHIDLIFIRPSAGNREGVPSGAWALHSGATNPVDWSMPEDPKDNIIRGAVASGDSIRSQIGSNSHAHGTRHYHTNIASSIGTGATGKVYQKNTAGFASAMSHVHYPAWTTEDTGASSSTNHEPAWQKLAVVENNTGAEDLPAGIMALFLGAIADIPAGWSLYDILDDWRYLKGAVDTTEVDDIGGSVAFDHEHTVVSHVHYLANEPSAPTVAGTGSGGPDVAASSHEHGWYITDDEHTLALTGGAVYPPCLYVLVLKFDATPAQTISPIGIPAGGGVGVPAIGDGTFTPASPSRTVRISEETRRFTIQGESRWCVIQREDELASLRRKMHIRVEARIFRVPRRRAIAGIET